MKVLKLTNLAAVALLAVPLAGYGQDIPGYGAMPGGYPPSHNGMSPASAMMQTSYQQAAPPAYAPAPGNAYGSYAPYDPYAAYDPYASGYGAPDAVGSYTGEPRSSLLWVNTELLSWRATGQKLPTLLTTSPTGSPQNHAGALNYHKTQTVFGDTGIDDGFRSGVRITLGVWATDFETTGYSVEYVGLDNASTEFQIVSGFSGNNNGIILARPFYDASTLREKAILLAYPDFNPDVNYVVPPVDLDGGFSFKSHSSTKSLAVDRRDMMWHDQASGYKSYFLLGYRYFNLDEEIGIHDRIYPVGPVGGPYPVGSFIDSKDQFEVENNFHGIELGVHTQYGRGPFTLDLLTKLALGNSHQVLNVNGTTSIYDGFNLRQYEGGTLTAPTNVGRYKQNEFAMVPEFGVTLGYQVTSNLKLSLGYSFLYYSSVLRPGDQMDTVLNPTQFDGGTLVGFARPDVNMRDTDYFLYGGNAGLEFVW